MTGRGSRGEQWVLASSNPGKLREMRRLLAGQAGLEVDLVAQSTLGVAPCAEPFESFLENALEKARHASRCAGLPALADDSGLVVDVLGGAPGVRSARFYADAQRAGEALGATPAVPGPSGDEQNWQWLLHRMRGVAEDDRTARFVAVLCFVRQPEDPMPIFGVGLWSGLIAARPAGQHGFGYDCVFFDRAAGQTAAEMSAEDKDARSHRGAAFVQFMDLYQRAYGYGR
ncbi:MAG: RdgB/HAM1 family non-canonical purine pyrophosphatase [Pseudomonadota bacterium]